MLSRVRPVSLLGLSRASVDGKPAAPLPKAPDLPGDGDGRHAAASQRGCMLRVVGKMRGGGGTNWLAMVRAHLTVHGVEEYTDAHPGGGAKVNEGTNDAIAKGVARPTPTFLVPLFSPSARARILASACKAGVRTVPKPPGPHEADVDGPRRLRP